MKQYIIINDTVNIKNARNEIVYQYHKGEKVEILDTAEWYWITKHGAVWFSQAKHEAEIKRKADEAALYLTFLLLAMTGRV